MKIEIENIIDETELLTINSIIAMIPNGNLDETYEFIKNGRNQPWNLQKSGIKIGRGGSHIWVSNKNNQRILLITE